jgi:tRNA pseudouridine13 synthase
MQDVPPQQSDDPSSRSSPPVYLTPDVAGIGGTLRNQPEDFVVEEIPLYEPTGEGEHLAMFIEKRNMSTLQLVSLLAARFGVRRRAVGYAGLKDKRAVTRQMMTVHLPGRPESEAVPLEDDRVRVIWAARHRNRLRRGHLGGNRFSICVRGVQPEAVLRARRVLEVLGAAGVPNRFGPQRFGVMGNNHLVGRALIRGEHQEAIDLLLSPNERANERSHREAREMYARGDLAGSLAHWPRSLHAERTILRRLGAGADAAGAVRSMDRSELGYYLSAFQSAVFNAVLDARLGEGALATLRDGDVAFKHDSRGAFLVDEQVLSDPDTARRLGALEISPSGPMWGPKMMRAGGDVERFEAGCLGDTGCDPDDLSCFRDLAGGQIEGSRRPLRVPIRGIDVEGGADERGTFVRCEFELPRGAFATVVLQEIMKSDETVIEAGGVSSS